MRDRSRWVLGLAVTLVGVALVLVVAGPPALAAPKGKPGVTPPGVPPGQPFRALQKEIDALQGQIDALKPQPGLMWINPLDLLAGSSALALNATTAGLDVATGVVGDVLQVGLQVPLGFNVTGAKVCYQEGAQGAFVSGVALLQNPSPVPTAAPAALVTTSFAAPGVGVVACLDTSPAISVDPSAGGALFLELQITPALFSDVITIRAIGIQLEPTP